MAEHSQPGPENIDIIKEILEHWQERLYAYCMAMLHHEHDATDVCQEVLVRVCQHAHKFDRDRSLGPWLFTIARNLCLDLLRKRREIQLNDIPEPASENKTAPPIERYEEFQKIQRIIDGLNEPYRSLLILKFNQGLSNREVAQVLDIPYSHFRVYLSRALEQVRRRVL